MSAFILLFLFTLLFWSEIVLLYFDDWYQRRKRERRAFRNQKLSERTCANGNVLPH